MRKSGKRKISAGTVAVLLMTMAILGGTVFVWLRLSSGKTVDLSRLKPEVEILQVKTGNEERIPEIAQTVMSTPIPVATQTPEPNNPEKNDPEPYLRSFTLTAAGTVSMAGEVRKNSYSSDAKQYDYSDTMTLLKKELGSDLNIVFTENLYSTENKPTDLIAPDAAAAMLKSACLRITESARSVSTKMTEKIISLSSVKTGSGPRCCSIRTQFRLPREKP